MHTSALVGRLLLGLGLAAALLGTGVLGAGAQEPTRTVQVAKYFCENPDRAGETDITLAELGRMLLFVVLGIVVLMFAVQVLRSGAFVEALRIDYDHEAWTRRFLRSWPAGSAAHASYFRRIADGPRFAR